MESRGKVETVEMISERNNKGKAYLFSRKKLDELLTSDVLTINFGFQVEEVEATEE